MKSAPWTICIVGIYFLLHCHSKMGTSQDWLSLFVNEDSPKVISFTPSSGSDHVSPKTEISILWSQPMEIQSCVSAFSLEPNTRGNFETTDLSLKFFPNEELSPIGYMIRLSKQCENKKGKDLDRVYSIPFSVKLGPTLPPPYIESFLISIGNTEECLSGGQIADRILGEVDSACLGNPEPSPMTIRFSKPMDQREVQLGLRLEPYGSFHLEWTDPNQVQIRFDEFLESQTRYQLILSSGISALDGSKIQNPVSLDFFIGEGPRPPEVIGFGLASQNCGLGIQELGSMTGARWDSISCFWSRGLAILSPHDYKFRGGDNGSGESGSPNACADVSTDNFKLFFDQYVDPISVISSSRLTKISPPTSNIRLATWEWGHCQNTFPYGCREITYSFAESEASCNGSVFGNNTTGGDFNLASSILAPNFYPYYEFRLDAEVRSVTGKRMASPFVIQMEAK
ncbi:Conserved hypothetical protein [Leptospira biflexa serovar Patoc strain 'Patoc 1 (Ames)']|uniref:SbsA Ig-like domain-containing protein n=1 Tax=Leptospira biflexa serovar Patoc (strain Patoc 1 / ATCC 23582 / Paris) TaxID=456481 RepID=B0SMG8_LEPBP|nr:Ig-like domain-containing protein [Leptospira biflexa]ABZ93483.1 Conserved hypothetical protein [Leptospira biflexa serovar Patoc strain 'Patoc 1 (Ames)']ABZ97112.1 Conserved hypothetical protein [Leptospira biflexa serovar Patoc strain 'Patoc 1 (Paris)']